MLKSLRKFNKNVFVYVTYPPPLSYPKRKGLSRGMCVDREGGIKGGGYVCALGITCEGCALNYKEREFRGGGLNLVFAAVPPPPYQVSSVLDKICIHLLAITNQITCR